LIMIMVEYRYRNFSTFSQNIDLSLLFHYRFPTLQSPQPPEAIVGLRAKPPEVRGSGDGAGRFLQFFNKNNTFFFVNFDQNRYFKPISHQLKAFEKQSKCIK